MRRQLVHGTFYQRFRLRTFPFDSQSLVVGVRSRLDSRYVVFEIDDREATRFSGARFQLPAWEHLFRGTPFAWCETKAVRVAGADAAPRRGGAPHSLFLVNHGAARGCFDGPSNSESKERSLV